MNSKAPSIIFQTENIIKSFPGVLAVDNVNFIACRGQLNALVGENGAGKSTLMKILAGVYPPDSGKLFLDNKEVSLPSTRSAQKHGIAIIHQELNLIPYLTIAENIFLGREFTNSIGLIDYPRMNREAGKLLDDLELHLPPQTPVANLRVGQQQIVEIAKALSCSAGILIMDEPTSAISEHEIDVLFRLIENLKKQGVTIIYITHKLDELFRIGDRVSVMRDGKLIGSDNLNALNHNDIVRMMVGRSITEVYKRSSPQDNSAGLKNNSNKNVAGNSTLSSRIEVLRAENLTLPHPERKNDYLVNNVSLTVKQGEVLGIFGLMGAGRTELLEIIFALHPDSSGKLYLHGKRITNKSPASAITAGIALAPEDRKSQGLILTMDIASNISLPCLDRIEQLFWLSSSKEKNLARKYIKHLKIKTPSHHQLVQNLSGGNQQKVIIGKWLATNPKILLLDEPTRGIDINAKQEIYRLIDKLTKDSLSIIMVSSEIPEILSICDRIMVMSEGEKTAEFKREEATGKKILSSALPGTLAATGNKF